MMGNHLDRFLDAQGPVWPDVLRELRAGRKQTHWMWFIFPQLRGLGRSDTARFYGIADRAEATAYLNHTILGARLIEATRLVLDAGETDTVTILGAIDALKFRSSMTLFAAVAGEVSMFADALRHFHASEADDATLRLLTARSPAP